jgi:hypothetical protein
MTGPSRLSSVPKVMLPVYEKIVRLTDDVCDRYLNSEYRDLARALTRLELRARERPPSDIGRIDQHGDPGGGGHQLTQQPQPLCHHLGGEEIDSGRVAAGPGEDQTELDRVLGDAEGNRNGLGRRPWPRVPLPWAPAPRSGSPAGEPDRPPRPETDPRPDFSLRSWEVSSVPRADICSAARNVIIRSPRRRWRVASAAR